MDSGGFVVLLKIAHQSPQVPVGKVSESLYLTIHLDLAFDSIM